MSWVSIDDWLRDLSCDTAVTTKTLPKKPAASRKRSRPLSPPMSSSTPSRKRQALSNPNENDWEQGEDTAGMDSQQTPRASKNSRSETASDVSSPRHRRYAPSLSPTKTSSVASSSRQSGAGRSSPTKQLSYLKLHDLAERSIDPADQDFPDALARLVEEIEDAALGRGILHPSQREVLQTYCDGDSSRARSRISFRECFRHSTLFAPEAPHTLPPSYVAFIRDEARHCEENAYSEQGWNAAVHFPLMRRVLLGDGPRSELEDKDSNDNRRLVDVTPCPTAKILNRYRVRDAPTKMVDYAITLKPGKSHTDRAFSEARIRHLCRSLGAASSTSGGGQCEATINHTDHPPLADRVLAVSIETKRTNDDFDEAKAQLLVWLAAQWRKIDVLIAEAGNQEEPPVFLPAIIVQGHDWHFVASTRDADKRVILWHKRTFGSTQSPLGIYQIAFTLRRLATWATDDYWPWFMKACLGSGQSQETPDSQAAGGSKDDFRCDINEQHHRDK